MSEILYEGIHDLSVKEKTKQNKTNELWNTEAFKKAKTLLNM